MTAHPNLLNPVHIRLICLFASKEAFHPVIFNSVTSSWSETQQLYRGAELAWRNLSSPENPNYSRKLEDKVKNVMIWCCRSCSNDWIFFNLIKSGLELSLKYPSVLQPIDVIFHHALAVRFPTKRIGPIDENAEEKVPLSRESKEEILNRFFRYAQILLETGKIVANPLTVTTAMKTLPPLEIFKLFFEKAQMSVNTKTTLNESFLVFATRFYIEPKVIFEHPDQDKIHQQKSTFEIIRYLVSIGADPSEEATGVFGTSKARPYESAVSHKKLELVKLFFEEPRIGKTQKESEDLTPSVNTFKSSALLAQIAAANNNNNAARTRPNNANAETETPWLVTVLNADYEMFKYFLVDIPQKVKHAQWKNELEAKQKSGNNNNRHWKYLAQFKFHPAGYRPDVMCALVQKAIEILKDQNFAKGSFKTEEHKNKYETVIKMMRLAKDTLKSEDLLGLHWRTRKGESLLEIAITESSIPCWTKLNLDFFKFLVDEIKIDVNILNSKGETPFVFALKLCDRRGEEGYEKEKKDLIDFMMERGAHS
jgi:hypothetical protein